MTQITDFQEQDAQALAALMVQAAINVSHAEDEGGEHDDKLEMRALDEALKYVAGSEKKPQIVRECAKLALDSKDKWEIWSQGVFKIEPLCIKAVTILRQFASKDEVREYDAAVLEIASAVAQAYGEFGMEEEPSKGILGAMIGKVFGGFGASDAINHPMNVSAAEDSALSIISKALKNA